MAKAKRDKDQETCAWAGEYVKQPWLQFLAVCADQLGEKSLTAEQRTALLPLIPLSADLENLYHLFSAVSPDILGPRPNLWTIVTDSARRKIVVSYLEREREGVYVSLEELAADGAWAAEALRLIGDRDWDGLRLYLERVGEEQYHFKPAIINVATLRFFEEFQRIYRQYHQHRNFALYLLRCFEVVRRVRRYDWLHTIPALPLVDRIQELAGKVVTVDAARTANLLSAVVPDFSAAFVILGRWWLLCGRLVMAQGRLQVTFSSQDLADELADLPFWELPGVVRRRLACDFGVVVDFEELRPLLHDFLSTPLPRSAEDCRRLIGLFTRFIIGFGRKYSIAPFPAHLVKPASILIELLLAPWRFAHVLAGSFPYARLELDWPQPDLNILVAVRHQGEMIGDLLIRIRKGAVRRIMTVGDTVLSKDVAHKNLQDLAVAFHAVHAKLDRKVPLFVVLLDRDYVRESLEGVFHFGSLPALWTSLRAQAMLPVRGGLNLMLLVDGSSALITTRL